MFRDKLKELIGKKEEQQEGNDKKKIENLVFLIILSIITIVIINVIWNGNKQSDKKETDSNSKQLATTNQISDNKNNMQTTDDLEGKLESILGNIQGVGAVKVCINYSESSEVVAMYNENSKISNTEETDTSGGTRKIQETDS